MSDCNNCSLSYSCRNDTSHVTWQYYHEFDMEIYSQVDDVQYYTRMIKGCVGYRSPFLEDDIKNIIVLSNTMGLLEIWVTDQKHIGHRTVFYLVRH